MGEYKNKAYPLRIDKRIMEKIKIVAEENDRTTNKQIENILREFLKSYEQENGEIKISEV